MNRNFPDKNKYLVPMIHLFEVHIGRLDRLSKTHFHLVVELEEIN